MNKKYIVRLSDEERAQLTPFASKGTAAAATIRHAHILLKADADGPVWTATRSPRDSRCVSILEFITL